MVDITTHCCFFVKVKVLFDSFKIPMYCNVLTQVIRCNSRVQHVVLLYVCVCGSVTALLRGGCEDS